MTNFFCFFNQKCQRNDLFMLMPRALNCVTLSSIINPQRLHHIKRNYRVAFERSSTLFIQSPSHCQMFNLLASHFKCSIINSYEIKFETDKIVNKHMPTVAVCFRQYFHIISGMKTICKMIFDNQLTVIPFL